MSPLAILSSFFVAVMLTVPALGQAPDEVRAGTLTPVQYYDPAPVYQWQQPRNRGWHSHQQQRYHAYQQWRMEQERRRQAYHHQRQLEAQRQWHEQQRRLHNEWQRRAYGQPPPRGRRLDPLREQHEEPRRGHRQASPDQRDGGERPEIASVAPEIIAFANSEDPGTIIIDTEARRLYYTISSREAYAYPISVGREGFGWHGTETVSRVASWPDWYPPESMRERQPELPKMMTGGINNPLGARAIYLGDTLYRIHGTNEESSIGQAASSGCFRMRNEHVVHLAGQVEVGAKVRVVERWPSDATASAGESG